MNPASGAGAAQRPGRRLPRRRLPALIATVIAVLIPGPAIASTRPADPPPADPPPTVRAVLVASYSGAGDPFWVTMNANWSSYGSIPVTVADAQISGRITLAALQATQADVVILSDPAGRRYQFTPAEIDALQEYASEGHELIGTFLLFAHGKGRRTTHDEAVAPLFGIEDELDWRGGGTPSGLPKYHRQDVPGARLLFNRLTRTYESTGYPGTEKPADNSWDASDLDGAEYAGRCGRPRCAITLDRAPSYNAIYIANMPEYGGGPTDEQFLYNAITFTAAATLGHSHG